MSKKLRSTKTKPAVAQVSDDSAAMWADLCNASSMAPTESVAATEPLVISDHARISCRVTWFIDGEETATGPEISMGTYAEYKKGHELMSRIAEFRTDSERITDSEAEP